MPRLLDRLLYGRQLLEGLGADDLREMCKFRERPNLAGLAVHEIERPLPADWEPSRDLRPREGYPELGEGLQRALSHGLNAQPVIVVRGLLGGGSPAALPVEIYIPQHGAQLALAMQALLHPWRGTAQVAARVRILCWHEPLHNRQGRLLRERMIAWWAEAGFALTIGHDDPSLLADILWDAAQRHWEAGEAEGRLLEEEATLAVIDAEGARARLESCEPPLATGRWLATLDTIVLERGAGGAQLATPLWANPMLPGECLGAGPDWREAALHPDAQAHGVAVDAEGQFSTTGEAAAGWVILPRHALPAPLPRRALRYEIVE